MDKAEITIVALLLVALLGVFCNKFKESVKISKKNIDLLSTSSTSGHFLEVTPKDVTPRGSTHAALRFVKDYQHHGGWWWMKLIERRATRTEAYYICLLEGSHLASPGNAVNTAAFEAVQSKHRKGIWTDWHAAPNKSYYSSYLGVHITKGFDRYIKSWGTRENNSGDRYLVSLPSRKVRESNGLEDLPFICGRWGQYWRFGNTACNSYDKEYTLHSSGNCFKLHQSGLEWNAALIKCRAEGGELAILEDNAEANFLVKLLERASNQEVKSGYGSDEAYVGIYYYHREKRGRWVTLHGTDMTSAGFSLMTQYEVDPPYSCGGFNIKGKYVALHCGKPFRFFCEKKPYTPL